MEINFIKEMVSNRYIARKYNKKEKFLDNLNKILEIKKLY